MPPTPFQLREAERKQVREESKAMAEKFRRARCPECKQPLLWHDGPDNERAKGLDCELKQEEIMTRLGVAELNRG